MSGLLRILGWVTTAATWLFLAGFTVGLFAALWMSTRAQRGGK